MLVDISNEWYYVVNRFDSGQVVETITYCDTLTDAIAIRNLFRSYPHRAGQDIRVLPCSDKKGVIGCDMPSK